jgi:hypothetical protein
MHRDVLEWMALLVPHCSCDSSMRLRFSSGLRRSEGDGQQQDSNCMAIRSKVSIPIHDRILEQARPIGDKSRLYSSTLEIRVTPDYVSYIILVKPFLSNQPSALAFGGGMPHENADNIYMLAGSDRDRWLRVAPLSISYPVCSVARFAR